MEGPLGGNRTAPEVISRRTRQEKEPWKSVPSLSGNVEVEFLRPLYLGESIVPYRTLDPQLAIVPWDAESGALLDGAGAQAGGHANLARWLKKAEALWSAKGTGRRTFRQQMDYYGQLSAQFPIAGTRVVYAASGTLPAAAVLRDATAVVEHKLYWAAVTDQREAAYLSTILNSETARQRVAHMQSRGQWGARDFDKVIFELPIPRFEAESPLHTELAQRGAEAEVAARNTDLAGTQFVAARKRVRDALERDGLAGKIDALVARLLDG